MTAPNPQGAMASASELAARVCHEEQMVVWSGEVMGSLSMGGYLREDWSYEDTINASAAVTSDLRSIVESAFDHPELKGEGGAPPPAVPESVRRLSEAATKGPWVSRGRFIGVPTHMSEIGETRDESGCWCDSPQSTGNAAFIAAAANFIRDLEAGALIATTPSGRADVPRDLVSWSGRPLSDWLQAQIDAAHTDSEAHPEGSSNRSFYRGQAIAYENALYAALPSGRADTPPAGGGAVPAGWRLVPVAMPDAAFLAIMEELRSGTPLADQIWEKATRAAVADTSSISCAPPKSLAAAPTAPEPAANNDGPFRVGRKVARHVYEGDEPLFTAASGEAAARYVRLLNAGLAAPEPFPVPAEPQVSGDGLAKVIAAKCAEIEGAFGREMFQTARPIRGIYIASKTSHGPRWRRLRAEGVPIISTWIDEAGKGETACFTDLWERCVDEAATATAVIVYRESGEVLKGAFVEVGAALSMGVPVYAVGCDEFSFVHHAGVTRFDSLEEALRRAAPPASPADAEGGR